MPKICTVSLERIRTGKLGPQVAGCFDHVLAIAADSGAAEAKATLEFLRAGEEPDGEFVPFVTIGLRAVS